MRHFGDPRTWPAQDLVAMSADLTPASVVAGYREGVFAMPLYWGRFNGDIGWWSPVSRGILPPEGARVTRSLRKSARHYRCTVDADFPAVLAGCADRRRPHGWIDGRIKRCYTALFEAGTAHSVEAWTPDGRLAGGLYGVSVGGLFAGESMFHAPFGRDASKVALLHLLRVLTDDGVARLVDVQWSTEHLASLGVIEVDRAEYLALLRATTALPEPDWDRWRESTHA